MSSMKDVEVSDVGQRLITKNINVVISGEAYDLL